MVKSIRFWLLLTVIIGLGSVIPYSVVNSAVPEQLNFQGILLNDDGGTVNDSTYQITFHIYDDSTGGSELWSETQTLPTENGLFNTFLGRDNPVPGTVFDEPTRWLEIELVGVGSYLPRNPIGSVAYAYRVESVNGATGGSIYGDVQLHSTMTIGDLDGNPGVLQLTDGNGITLILDGTNVGSVFPDSIITSEDITNESGIAADFESGSTTLPQNTSSMTNLTSVTITTPSDGYIVLQGRCIFRAEGSFWQNMVRTQIDEAPNASLDPVHYSEAGSYLGDDPDAVATASSSTSAFFNLTKTIYTDRVYYKPAGTYTFYLEAMAHEDNAPYAVSKVRNAFLTATFHATSYGPVETSVESADVAKFQSTQVITANPEDGATAASQYRVDLRELELKAARLEAELERTKRRMAEFELQRSQER